MHQSQWTQHLRIKEKTKKGEINIFTNTKIIFIVKYSQHTFNSCELRSREMASTNRKHL